MTRARLKLIICPSCRGRGFSPALGFRCAWCVGLRRVPVLTALRWCAQCEGLAYSGFIDGTHDVQDMREMEAEAMAVRQLIASYGGCA